MYPPEPFRTDYTVVLGIRTNWWIIAGSLFPFVLWLWMLWSGNWRRPVLTAALVYGTAFFVGMFEFEFAKAHTPPEKRMIRLFGTEGTDVYCNGVHLGQLPLRIHVDELIAKVPEWDTPPLQRWYDDRVPEQRLCTWFPWDDFRRERFEASKELFGANNPLTVVTTPRAVRERQELLNKHDVDCRYWWSFRHGETQLAFLRMGNTGYLHRPFDDISDYYPQEFSSAFSPSTDLHVQLLIDVLPELTPEEKADWDRHVLENWTLLGIHLKTALGQTAASVRRQDKNDPQVELYETALHSTALLKYNLSDPPTEEECRRLLADWAVDSIEDSAFRFTNNRYDMFFYGASSTPTVSDFLLMPAGIEETMRKPVAEQWKRNKFRFPNGWAPVAYFSWKGKSPDYFADFARFSAVTNEARLPMLENESLLTVALFRTLLHRREYWEYFNDLRVNLYPGRINTYSLVNNPLTEPEMREYIVKALSDPKHTELSRRELERSVMGAIYLRMDRPDIDRDELASWIASLPLPASSKSRAQRFLRFRPHEAMSFADQLQHAAGRQALIDTELTLADVFQWFAENPEGNVVQFLAELHEDMMVSEGEPRDMMFLRSGLWNTPTAIGRVDDSESRWGNLPQWFVLALLRSDTAEGNPQIRDLIRHLWKHDRSTLEEVIVNEYGGLLRPLQPRRETFETGIASNVPDYILDLYFHEGEVVPSGPQMMVSGFSFASVLATCDSPKAGLILEKWVAGSEGTAMRPQLERLLETYRARSALRQRKMEVFRDLAAGRVHPDDLLWQQSPWVWKDGEYVQGNL